MFGVKEEALALQKAEERVLEKQELMVFDFQGVGAVSCQLVVGGLSLKLKI